MRSINFSSIDSTSEASAVVIDKQKVKELVHAISMCPAKLDAHFKVIDNVFTLSFTFTYCNNLTQTIVIPCNENLLEALLPCLCKQIKANGKITEFINDETEELALIQKEGEDIKVELFKQFLASPFHGYREKDFSGRNGMEYMSFTFSTYFNYKFHFIFVKSETITQLWMEALRPGFKRETQLIELPNA